MISVKRSGDVYVDSRIHSVFQDNWKERIYQPETGEERDTYRYESGVYPAPFNNISVLCVR